MKDKYISPIQSRVDVLSGHKRTNNHQGTASRPWRDRGKNRCEKHGDKESESSENGSETSLSSLYILRILNSCNWR